jgi:hypothetical protein
MVARFRLITIIKPASGPYSIDSLEFQFLHLRWLVFGSSTYYLYAFVASILAALMSSLI